MTDSGLPRRTRAFLLWTARLALVAFLIQLGAVDHWHADFGNVVDVEGSSAHVEHCHGTGDCSTSGGSALALNASPATVPVPSIVALRIESPLTRTPQAAFITPPSEPPQAA